MPLSILFVDDDAGSRADIELMVQRAGHRVVCVGNVDTALAWVRQGRFDVIVIDIFIGEDAIEIVRSAHAHQPAARVVAISDGGAQTRASFALELAVAFGAVAPLQKPFTFDQLQAAAEPALIRDLLAGSRSVEHPAAVA